MLGPSTPRPDPQGARALHGVDGVVDQVRPDLVELTGVDLDDRKVGVVLLLDLDALELGDRASPACCRCPPRMSTDWRDDRSICEYDFTAPTRLAMREVLSRISARRSLAEITLTTQDTAPSSASGPVTSIARSHHATSTPAPASTGARLHGSPTPWAESQVPSASSTIGQGHRRRRAAPPRSPRRRSWSSGDELLGGDGRGGEIDERREHGVARLPHGGRRRAQRGRRRVVDLVGETGGERAQRDQRLALADHRLDVADGLEDADDDVPAEREPLPHEPLEVVGGHRPGSDRRSRPGPWRGTRRPSPQAIRPPAHCPGVVMVTMRASSPPAVRNRSISPSSRIHNSSAGSPSTKRVSPSA